MHELSVALSIVELAEQYAKKHQANEIEEIELEIGNLAGIEIKTLLFALESSVKGTLLEKAKIVRFPVESMGRCTSCKNEFPIKNLYSACPNCKSYGVRVTQGKELKVKSILVK